MKNKNKSLKISLLLVIGVIFIGMAAASASADIIKREADSDFEEVVEQDIPADEGNLISPGPEEPLIIAPNPNLISEQTEKTDDLVIAGDTTDKSEYKDTGIYGFVIITVIAGTIAALVIIKRKK